MYIPKTRDGWRKWWLRKSYRLSLFIANLKPNPDPQFPWVHISGQARVPERWLKRHLSWVMTSDSTWRDGRPFTAAEIREYEKAWLVPDIKDHVINANIERARLYRHKVFDTATHRRVSLDFSTYAEFLQAQQQ